MASAIIGEVAAGATRGAAEGTIKPILEKDPDVVMVPLKMVGYSGGAFIMLVFILMMVGLLFFALRFMF